MNRKNISILLLILILALGLRLANVGTQSLWHDEAYSANVSALALGEIFSKQISDPTPPFYYWFLHFWILLFGASETSLRFPSVLFNLAAIFMVFQFGKKYLDEKTAGIAALLFALSPYQIFYSQEARMYSLFVFLSIWSIWEFRRALDKTGWFAWIRFGVVSTLLVYTHAFGVFLLVGLNFFVLDIRLREKKNITPFWLVQIGIVGLFGLWMVPTLDRLSAIGFPFEPWSEWSHFLQTFGYFCCTGWRIPDDRLENLIVFAGSWVFISVIVSSFYFFLRTKNRELPFLWSVGLIPLLLIFSISWVKPIFVPGRYDVAFYPACALLAGYALARFHRVIQIPILIFFLGMNGYFLHSYYLEFKKSSDRELAEYLRKHVDEKDTVIFSNLTHAAANYYFPSKIQKRISFPKSELGFLSKPSLQNEGQFGVNAVDRLAKRLFTKKPADLWFVYNRSPVMNLALMERLNGGFRFEKMIPFSPGRNDNQPEALIHYSWDRNPVRAVVWPEEQLSLTLDCKDNQLCLASLENGTVDRKKIRIEVFPVDRYIHYTEFRMEGDWKISHQWNPYPPPRFNFATALVSSISRDENSSRLIGNFHFEPGFTRIWIHTLAETSYDPSGNSRASVRLEIGDSLEFLNEPSLGSLPSGWVFFPMGSVYRTQGANLPMVFSLVHNGKQARENFDLRGVILNRVDSRESKLTRNRVIAELSPQSTYKLVIPWKGEKFLVWVLTNPKTGRGFDYVLSPRLERQNPKE